eukprot:359935-Chlamydomonas_euryale.AAC.4
MCDMGGGAGAGTDCMVRQVLAHMRAPTSGCACVDVRVQKSFRESEALFHTFSQKANARLLLEIQTSRLLLKTKQSLAAKKIKRLLAARLRPSPVFDCRPEAQH